MNAEAVRARLQTCAKAVQNVVGEDVRFVLLVFPPPEDNGAQQCEYISNGNREDVWKAVAQWVLETSGKPLGDS